MSVGENIKNYRKRLGISQSQLSDLSGIPQTTISSLENRENAVPNLVISLALANALKIDVNDLLKEPMKEAN